MGTSADAIEDGVAIAAAAARMAVKNHILVSAIRDDESFDRERVAAFAHQVLKDLADEHDRAAKHMRKTRKKAALTPGRSLGTHDYVAGDTRNLRKRQKQYEGVAKRLRDYAIDPIQVESLVEQARDLAWYDVQANIERRLDLGTAPRLEHEGDDDAQHDPQIGYLTGVDLATLEEQRRQLAELQAEIKRASGAVDLPARDDSPTRKV